MIVLKDEPDIFYAETGSSAIGHYDPTTNQIVLNEQLKDYPLAHSYILGHEYKHYELGANLFGQLWHELKNDFQRAFSLDPAVEEMREYYDAHEVDSSLKWNMLAAMIVNMIRGIWNIVFVPTGLVYRKIRKSRFTIPFIQKNAENG